MSDALFDLPPIPEAKAASAYRVLARKYRPQTFTELKGQEALVRTLTNAFAGGRIAHAFILTGVRGVGKTTTARIIAKGLNCESGPTIAPCGTCTACTSIADGRNMDVIELNAADNRKIEDVRKIIEGAKYAPTAARTKIYILDEVHMFVDEAFNALLKILEEPPAHVKFILATTEIRKVPVTILSRCQRFDLRRIEPEVLAAHFAEVCAKEGVAIEADALALLARAAEGSARDGLSLLDQAMAQATGPITVEQLRSQLGLAARLSLYELLASALAGDAAAALAQLDEQHKAGAEPESLVKDLLECTHQLARLKVLPEGRDFGTTAAEAQRLRDLAAQHETPVLARAWQVLLKGAAEVRTAPVPAAALEMVLIRLAHMASLPSPGDLVKKLTAPARSELAGTAGSPPPPNGPAMRLVSRQSSAAVALAPAPAVASLQRHPETWAELVALFAERKEVQLYAQLQALAECVSFAPGQLEIFLRPGAPAGLAQKLAAKAQEWTGQRWLVTLARSSATTTLAEDTQASAQARLDELSLHPLVQAVLTTFPGAKITAIRDTAPTPETLQPDEE